MSSRQELSKRRQLPKLLSLAGVTQEDWDGIQDFIQWAKENSAVIEQIVPRLEENEKRITKVREEVHAIAIVLKNVYPSEWESALKIVLREKERGIL